MNSPTSYSSSLSERLFIPRAVLEVGVWEVWVWVEEVVVVVVEVVVEGVCAPLSLRVRLLSSLHCPPCSPLPHSPLRIASARSIKGGLLLSEELTQIHKATQIQCSAITDRMPLDALLLSNSPTLLLSYSPTLLLSCAPALLLS
jgi:hypothetical protein